MLSVLRQMDRLSRIILTFICRLYDADTRNRENYEFFFIRIHVSRPYRVRQQMVSYYDYSLRSRLFRFAYIGAIYPFSGTAFDFLNDNSGILYLSGNKNEHDRITFDVYRHICGNLHVRSRQIFYR